MDAADWLEFEWDDANLEHIARHGVSPEEVEQVVENDPVDSDLYWVEDEERLSSVGPTSQGRFLHVATTMRGDRVRCVTAFDATRQEVRNYLIRKGILQ